MNVFNLLLILICVFGSAASWLLFHQALKAKESEPKRVRVIIKKNEINPVSRHLRHSIPKDIQINVKTNPVPQIPIKRAGRRPLASNREDIF